ncbi:hypothetical protein RRG08_062827 [Elysia crispata]|uniref:Uncharacterized protein n=1 Tax=Elysia crispata TaxID=231223 RepID=A0AAE1DPC8_9GAST|nr:hypothetical protein RRG08_062827 [Elysia crispata]
MSTPDKVYLYQFQDPEKTFLRKQLYAFCLDTINELRNSLVDAQVDGFDENIESDNLTNVLSKVNPALLKGPVPTDEAEAGDKACWPERPTTAKRGANMWIMFIFLQRCIQQNPGRGLLARDGATL